MTCKIFITEVLWLALYFQIIAFQKKILLILYFVSLTRSWQFKLLLQGHTHVSFTSMIYVLFVGILLKTNFMSVK